MSTLALPRKTYPPRFVESACCPACGQPLLNPKRLLSIDLVTGRVEFQGVAIVVQKRQSLILHALNEAYPKALSKERLISKIYTEDELCELEGPESSIMANISKLRQLLRIAGMPIKICSARSCGYWLEREQAGA